MIQSGFLAGRLHGPGRVHAVDSNIKSPLCDILKMIDITL